MLINLLKNALEAMPQGGEITITSRVKGANAEISLADTGEGMSPEVAANIFQPYFTTKEKGTGLGLAICQGIIQEHGGVISGGQHPGPGDHLYHPAPPQRGAGGGGVIVGDAKLPLGTPLQAKLLLCRESSIVLHQMAQAGAWERGQGGMRYALLLRDMRP